LFQRNDSSVELELQLMASTVYNKQEVVKDLLAVNLPTKTPTQSPSVADGLKVRETPARGVWVEVLTHIIDRYDLVVNDEFYKGTDRAFHLLVRGSVATAEFR